MTPIQISLIKQAGSPYWLVFWRSRNGKQRKRSTKVPHEGGLFAGEKLSKAQAEKRAYFIGYQIATKAEEEYSGQDNTTVRQLFDIMLAGKLGLVSLATYENARTDYNQFCKWLGKRANEPARLINKGTINEWVMARRAEVRCKTVKKALTAISSAFKWAVEAEKLPSNPCLGVRIPPDNKAEKTLKEAFTSDEISLLLHKLPDEWSSAVRCCIGTYGQRLGDILSLKWEQFDFASRVVRITTGKTARTLVQPMQEDFYSWASLRYKAAQQQGGDAAIWVHPKLRKNTNPSTEFTQLVRMHGIGLKGESAGGRRRTWHSKTFHSLRASVVTMLHAAGVSQGLAMYLVGHDSQEVHTVYLRPSEAQLALAAASLPKF